MNAYLIPLSELFEAHANPVVAASMKKYMKGQFEYFGIKSPERKELKQTFLGKHGLPSNDKLIEITKDCWGLPQREFQYAFMEILGRLAKKGEKERIDLYEFLIENKSWWDTVDYIASNLVGVHFEKYPELIKPFTEKWMNSGNMWLERTAILFQLKYKNKTDLELLSDLIQRIQGSKEFFINKAIGWILREYSKTDKNWVIHYVDTHQLAPLSKREALKWLKNKNKI